eukprot:TRINITY_DN20970_c0_g1_i1.p1 TRINITY_DN20970_c0_g1~~TRINITY_DN20970_c0_g1_i1.p1  ORF type:complete len:825 (+),score=192.61 TRINITY_DN20970_c0_g1_i1:53-2527(+)
MGLRRVCAWRLLWWAAGAGAGCVSTWLLAPQRPSPGGGGGAAHSDPLLGPCLGPAAVAGRCLPPLHVPVTPGGLRELPAVPAAPPPPPETPPPAPGSPGGGRLQVTLRALQLGQVAIPSDAEVASAEMSAASPGSCRTRYGPGYPTRAAAFRARAVPGAVLRASANGLNASCHCPDRDGGECVWQLSVSVRVAPRAGECSGWGVRHGRGPDCPCQCAQDRWGPQCERSACPSAVAAPAGEPRPGVGGLRSAACDAEAPGQHPCSAAPHNSSVGEQLHAAAPGLRRAAEGRGRPLAYTVTNAGWAGHLADFASQLYEQGVGALLVIAMDAEAYAHACTVGLRLVGTIAVAALLWTARYGRQLGSDLRMSLARFSGSLLLCNHGFAPHLWTEMDVFWLRPPAPFFAPLAAEADLVVSPHDVRRLLINGGTRWVARCSAPVMRFLELLVGLTEDLGHKQDVSRAFDQSRLNWLLGLASDTDYLRRHPVGYPGWRAWVKFFYGTPGRLRINATRMRMMGIEVWQKDWTAELRWLNERRAWLGDLKWRAAPGDGVLSTLQPSTADSRTQAVHILGERPFEPAAVKLLVARHHMLYSGLGSNYYEQHAPRRRRYLAYDGAARMVLIEQGGYPHYGHFQNVSRALVALAHATGRVLVLPHFLEADGLSVVGERVIAYDSLPVDFRESTFLDNPRIPRGALYPLQRLHVTPFGALATRSAHSPADAWRPGAEWRYLDPARADQGAALLGAIDPAAVLVLVQLPARAPALSGVLDRYGCAARGVVFCQGPVKGQYPPHRDRHGHIMEVKDFDAASNGPHAQRSQDLRTWRQQQ